MERAFVSLLTGFIKANGKKILDQPDRFKSLFLDSSQNKYRAEAQVFAQFLASPQAQELKNSEDVDAVFLKSIVERFHQTYLFDKNTCEQTVMAYAWFLGLIDKKTFEARLGGSAAGNKPEASVRSPPTPPEPAAEPGHLHTTGQSSPSEKQPQSNVENTGSVPLVAVIILGIIGIAVSSGIGYSKYKEMESHSLYWRGEYEDMSQRYEDMSQRYEDMSQRYEDMSQRYEEVNNILNMEITAITAGNQDQNRTQITRPGDRLSASQMRFLYPVITYNSNVAKSVTLFVKIIRPNGELLYNSSASPPNYTFKQTVQIRNDTNLSETLQGWGWNDPAPDQYNSGTWTIEVWYNDVCLKSQKIRIYP